MNPVKQEAFDNLKDLLKEAILNTFWIGDFEIAFSELFPDELLPESVDDEGFPSEELWDLYSEKLDKLVTSKRLTLANILKLTRELEGE